jgi:hypothetical protein
MGGVAFIPLNVAPRHVPPSIPTGEATFSSTPTGSVMVGPATFSGPPPAAPPLARSLLPWQLLARFSDAPPLLPRYPLLPPARFLVTPPPSPRNLLLPPNWFSVAPPLLLRHLPLPPHPLLWMLHWTCTPQSCGARRSHHTSRRPLSHGTTPPAPSLTPTSSLPRRSPRMISSSTHSTCVNAPSTRALTTPRQCTGSVKVQRRLRRPLLAFSDYKLYTSGTIATARSGPTFQAPSTPWPTTPLASGISLTHNF